jgi:hypothetical protein
MIIASDDWDHSRKFPAFSTSKNINEYHGMTMESLEFPHLDDLGDRSRGHVTNDHF